MLTLFGLSVFCFLFFGMLWRDSCRWRHLAEHYAGGAGTARDTRTMQNGVIFGFGGYSCLKGILTIGLHEKGASLSIFGPFSLFHAPLFIPYDDIRGWKTIWYIDAPSVELEFARAPKVKLVVSAKQAEWIAGRANGKLVLYDLEPPNGRAGRGWRAVTLTSAAIKLAMLAATIVILVFRTG